MTVDDGSNLFVPISAKCLVLGIDDDGDGDELQ